VLEIECHWWMKDPTWPYGRYATVVGSYHYYVIYSYFYLLNFNINKILSWIVIEINAIYCHAACKELILSIDCIIPVCQISN